MCSNIESTIYQVSMNIKTKRLIITEFNESMIESVYLNSQDEDNKRFVPDEVYESIDEAKEVVHYLINQYNSQDGPFVYPILLHDETNIGYVQLVHIDEGWEIGYHIAKQFTKLGYATEAVKAILPFAMEKLNINQIYGICLEENVASYKVLEKAGFTLEYKGLSTYLGNKRLIQKYKYSI